jgi:hypothetical protein
MDNNIKGLFVTYEIALKLKEKGFNEQCLAFFNGVGDDMLQPIDTDFINFREIGECIAAPLWQQVFTWLRDVHDIDINIETGGLPKMYAVFVKDWIYENEKDRALFTYEDAQEQAILKALELI